MNQRMLECYPKTARCWLALGCIVLSGWCLLAPLVLAETIDFVRDVRPILSEHCFKCHGFDDPARQAGLRLDTLDGMRMRLASGHSAVVPGGLAQSELISRITSADDALRMPPADVAEPLTEHQIQILTDWIGQGAVWSDHWAFISPVRQGLPKLSDNTWPINTIDSFILSALEQRRIRPSVVADRSTLLRRLSLDLIGLPPDLSEMEQSTASSSPDFYERAVDRLLASPHYGERMARRWLDLARYADSSGYANDRRRSIWPYRDWVVSALNADLPFDQFTIEQLAGDLLPNAAPDQVIASGFHRNTPHQYEGGSDPEQYRVERVKNRVDTTGTVWLGMTVACAQCHTHKHDPIAQREYYELYAFFNSADELQLPIASASQQQALSTVSEKIATLRAELEQFEEAQQPQKLKDQWESLKKSRDKIQQSVPTTLVMQELPEPRATFLQIRGDFLDPGDPVQPGTPVQLHTFLPSAEPLANRLDLAVWLVQPDNPLTGRVTVNRAWQHFMGMGIVETESDFGHQGSLPTHPQLLDWLAREFVDGGFSLKRLHREIVRSATYRQVSHVRQDLVELDPRNRLFARQSRHRVEGEVIRDIALTASGLLSRQMGGPSVFPPIPPNVMGTSSANHKWPTSSGPDRYRRGLYTTIYRANVYPMLSAFDGPDRDNACSRRNRSNTPLQSLAMANEPAMDELFRGLSMRILMESLQQDDESRMEFAFRICMGRGPEVHETNRLLEFFRQQRDAYQADPSLAEPFSGADLPPRASHVDLATWYTVSRLLMNLDEFITRE